MPHKHTQLVLLTIAMILIGILAVGYFVYQNQQAVVPIGPNDPIIKQKKESGEQFCGGIAGFPCPEGYECKLEGTYPDAGGTCIIK